MPPAQQHLGHTGRDLARPDQHAERHGGSQTQPTVLQDGQQVHADHGGQHCGQGEIHRQQPERDTLAPVEHCGDGRGAMMRAGRYRARDAVEVERGHHQQIDNGIHAAGAAPAQPANQQRRNRPGDGAGKAAIQCDQGNDAARLLAIQPPDAGEGRIIQPGAHTDPQHQPAQRIHRQPRRHGQHRKTDARQHRPGRQHATPAMGFDQPPDPGGDQTRDQQPQAEAAHHPAA